MNHAHTREREDRFMDMREQVRLHREYHARAFGKQVEQLKGIPQLNLFMQEDKKEYNQN